MYVCTLTTASGYPYSTCVSLPRGHFFLVFKKVAQCGIVGQVEKRGGYLLPYHMIHRAGRIKRERVGQKREGESIKKNPKASLDVSAFEEKTSANNLLLVGLATCSSAQVFSLSVRVCQSGYFYFKNQIKYYISNI